MVASCTEDIIWRHSFIIVVNFSFKKYYCYSAAFGNLGSLASYKMGFTYYSRRVSAKFLVALL